MDKSVKKERDVKAKQSRSTKNIDVVASEPIAVRKNVNSLKSEIKQILTGCEMKPDLLRKKLHESGWNVAKVNEALLKMKSKGGFNFNI